MKIELKDGWRFRKVGASESQEISLPYDAMFHEERTPDAPGMNSSGYFPGGDYIYERDVFLSEDDRKKAIFLEFEGVYHHAEVFINDLKDAAWDNGYRNFSFEIDDKAAFGKKNSIRVIAHNSDQPNSRWYSGAGIYRPVYLYILPANHLDLDGVKIETVSAEKRQIRVHLSSNGVGPVMVEVKAGDKLLGTSEGNLDHEGSLDLTLPEAKLWSLEEPNLLTCHVRYLEDDREVRFGLRDIVCNAKSGLLINGRPLLLKGACIHADNGLLGACSYPEAERRKVKLLQAAGYNAIRCAHNPCAKALLDACDELGMLVMDEYADMWLMHKCKYDYATYLPHQWEQDLTAMIGKDYNHPSVLIISLGNEVGESAKKEGIALCQQMSDFVRKNGNHWLTSAGINVFFNYLSSLGLGVYSDKKADKKASVGSEFFNKLAGLLGDTTMKRGAALPGVDRRIRGVYQTLDVAGYNYGILRYKKDHRKYPNRVILGSETFCKDAASWLEMAKTNPALIGDFVWSGMDYLGEAGVGAWEYHAYAEDYRPTFGWISAGSGRIDLCGNPSGESLYTQVVYGLSKLEMAVRPVMGEKDHSPSAWKMTNALASWSFEGHEGEKAVVEVYADADHFALMLNGKLIARQKVKASRWNLVKVRYQPGELSVISYDKDNREIAKRSLFTASKETCLSLQSETPAAASEGLVYLPLTYQDKQGIWKPLARGEITLEVMGGKLLGFGNACPFNKRGYLTNKTDTYFGRALAIVQAGKSGDIAVKATSPFGVAALNIPIKTPLN